jgi:hypothetical protein
MGKLRTFYICSAIGHVSQLWPSTLPKPMMYRTPTRPIWAQLEELRDCWTACRTVTPFTANNYSRLQPMTTAGYSHWPQQVAANEHIRPHSHDYFISIQATYVSWQCHPLRPDSLRDLVIVAYHFHGQEDEVAAKLRPLQSSQEEMHRLTGSGEAAQKLRNAGG